jgi:hypothetical protein
MSTGHNNGDGSGGCIEIFQQENCRIAYTLNNTQPVRCSYIGDQPLFFMDYEGDLDAEFADDDAEDPFGIGMIEQGVAALKDRIMALEHSLGVSPDVAAERVDAFIAAQEDMLGVAVPMATSDLRLKTIERDLKTSRLAGAYLSLAQSHGVSLAFSDQVEYAFYDRDAKTVFINPKRDETVQLLLAARELRRVWQHKNGALLHPLTFHPDQAILVNRAQRADLCVSMIRIAWEWQLSGLKAPWDYLENSSLSDLTRSFAREAYLDFRTLNNGQAGSAVFESWFLSDRCRHEDRVLIQHMLSDYQGYMFDSESASRTVSADLMLALGSMPFGKNYLAPFVSTILSDPIFAEVRDRSNANFLWFIKFERSFREAEQDLQTSHPIQGHTNSSGTSKTKTLSDGDNNEQTHAVIPLPGMASRPAPDNKTGKGRILTAPAEPAGATGGNIVHFEPRFGKRGRE